MYELLDLGPKGPTLAADLAEQAGGGSQPRPWYETDMHSTSGCVASDMATVCFVGWSAASL